MKRTLLSILFLASLYLNVNAQSFSLENGSAVNATVNGGLAKIFNKVKNTNPTGGDPVTITWKVTNHDFPASWTDVASEFGICDNIQCYGNGILAPNQSLIMAAIQPQEEVDFHMQINLDAATVGSHNMTVNLREPGGTNQNMTFTINRFPTGVTTITKSDDNIVMYPNPAKDFVNVIFNAEDNVKTISIHNMIGKLVNIYKVSTNSARLETGDLPAGVYFVRLQDAQGRIVGTRKFTHQ